MNKYFIKKEVVAKNLKEAIKNEKYAETVEIYKDFNYVHPKKEIKPYGINH